MQVIFLVALLENCTIVAYDYIVRVLGPESKHFFKGPGHNVNIFMTLHLMWTVLISTNKTAEMVLQATSKVCIYKFIDWTLFIALCAVSIFFMVDCLHKYTNKSTYFEVSTKKANSIEAPIITICFEPAYKKPALAKFNLEQFPSFDSKKRNYSNEEIFVKSAYKLGRDFILTAGSEILGGNGLASINKIGKVDLPKDASIAIEIKPMVTYSNGRCYQLVLEVEKVELMYIDFHFYFWSAVMPNKVKVSIAFCCILTKMFKENILALVFPHK